MRHILLRIPLPLVQLPLWGWLLIVLAGAAVGLLALELIARLRGRSARRSRSGSVAAAGAAVAFVIGSAVAAAVGRPVHWHYLPIMGYGLMIVLGFATAIPLAIWRARRCGENPDHVVNLSLLALIGGIGGARLFYVFEHWDEFAGRGLFAIFNVQGGGLVYYGGLILATLLAAIYLLRKKLSSRRILDILAPSLMLGLAFGRAGCTMNGCCWGGKCELDWAPKISFPFASPAFSDQTHLPWKVVDPDTGQTVQYLVAPPGTQSSYRHVVLEGPPPQGPVLTVPEPYVRQVAPRQGLDPDARPQYVLLSRDEIAELDQGSLAGRFRSLPINPAQLYGIFNALLLCLILTVFFRRRRREGQVFALMLILYPISRFLLEAVRRDTAPNWDGLTTSQNISLLMLAGGIVMWLVIRKLPAVAQVPLTGRPGAQDKPRSGQSD